jgi:hypothetical protein
VVLQLRLCTRPEAANTSWRCERTSRSHCCGDCVCALQSARRAGTVRVHVRELDWLPNFCAGKLRLHAPRSLDRHGPTHRLMRLHFRSVAIASARNERNARRLRSNTEVFTHLLCNTQHTSGRQLACRSGQVGLTLRPCCGLGYHQLPISAFACLLTGACGLLTSLRRFHNVVTLPSQSGLFTTSRRLIAGVARPGLWRTAQRACAAVQYIRSEVQQRKFFVKDPAHPTRCMVHSSTPVRAVP